jgi:hypothetical protein
MVLRTPGRMADPAVAFPALAEQARVAVRLHPRRGTPGPLDSSVGGPLLWPAEEPWPHCAEHEAGSWELVAASEPGTLAAAIPMVAVAQVFARDVPELPFPAGADVCQVLWCPAQHGDALQPLALVRWRDSTAVGVALAEPPSPGPDLGTGEFRPQPCALDPERVVDYPDPWELDDGLRQEIEAWAQEHGSSYFDLATAPGTKAVGWPDWIQHPEYPACTCGAAMEHLLTLASWECDGASWPCWLPEQERAALTFHPPPAGGDPEQYPLLTTTEDAGLMIGDAGNFYLFTCTRCADRPVRTASQCS